VYYVFLRGVDDAEEGEPTGWYVDRPPKEVIDALEAFADGSAV
jgi:hypothetical protein